MSQQRQAKYCPRCGTMAILDAAVCQTCGHQFHTGVEAPQAQAAKLTEEDFNKTQLFMMPPVMTRPQNPAQAGSIPVPLEPRKRILTPKRLWLTAGVVLVLLAVLLAAGRILLGPRPAHPAAVVGRWSRDSASGAVGLMFALDGSGALFWQPAPGAKAGSAGSVPLHWRQTQAGELSLQAPLDVHTGPDVARSVDALTSRPWTWRADNHHLTLGNLTFTRQD